MIVRYSIKKPKGQRKSFAIMRDVIYEASDRNVPKGDDGRPVKRQQVTLQLPEVDALNIRYAEGLESKNRKTRLEESEVIRQLKQVIIPALKAKDGTAVKTRAINTSMFEESNNKLFLGLWEKRYEDDDNDNRASGNDAAKNEFKKALKLIDPLPLDSIDRKSLKKHWEAHGLNVRQSRRYGTRVNQLLEYAGRDFRLKLPKRNQTPEIVKHLTIEEFTEDLLPWIDDPEMALLAQVLFGTGVRWGEAFAFNDPSALRANRTIHVHKQMLEKKYGTKVVPYLKNGKPHDTIILPQFIEAFEKWAAIPLDRKKQLRESTLTEKYLPKLMKAMFKSSSKFLKNHDFRHSYAIHMLSRAQLNTSTIALLIGDTEQTVKDNYVGFIVTDIHADFVNGRVDDAYKVKKIAAKSSKK